MAFTVGHTEFWIVLFQRSTNCRFRATGLSHCVAGLSIAIALKECTAFIFEDSMALEDEADVFLQIDGNQ